MNKLYMENYLLILKSTVEVYIHGTLESSNKDIKDCLRECLNDTLKHQENTYNCMKENGWYQIDNVESNVISQTLEKVKNN